MTRRAIFHFVCALLLLVAQHSALTHAVWHLHDLTPFQGPHQHAETGSDQKEGGEQSPQSKLCDFHADLGAVLAGDCGGAPAVVPVDFTQTPVAVPADGHAVRFTATHRSRAPPVLL